MTEKDIAIKAKKILEDQHWLVWQSHKKAFYPAQDIFGCFDLVVLRDGKIKFIQLTTKGHISDRQKKIKGYFDVIKWTPPPYEIWGYDAKAEKFTIFP